MPKRPRNKRPSSHARGYTAAAAKHVKEAIRREPWCHTVDCPYPDAGTETNQLCGDHIDPQAVYGRQEFSHWTQVLVLCKRCNSSKGARR